MSHYLSCSFETQFFTNCKRLTHRCMVRPVCFPGRRADLVSALLLFIKGQFGRASFTLSSLNPSQMCSLRTHHCSHAVKSLIKVKRQLERQKPEQGCRSRWRQPQSPAGLLCENLRHLFILSLSQKVPSLWKTTSLVSVLKKKKKHVSVCPQ